jgi:hypothetical protein
MRAIYEGYVCRDTDIEFGNKEHIDSNFLKVNVIAQRAHDLSHYLAHQHGSYHGSHHGTKGIAFSGYLTDDINQ